MRFRDRRDAGRQLADRLQRERLHQPLVLALPRGGVPVAAEIAAGSGVQLDVLVVRKVGAPFHREYGIGAVAEPDVTIRDDSALRAVGVSVTEFEQLAAAERDELDRRVAHYRGSRPLPDIAGRDVVLVDDGLATGVTAEAAIAAARSAGAGRIVLAVPVAAADTAARLAGIAEVVCLATPSHFRAVGEWYDDFSQTSDAEVVRLLDEANRRATG
jgi:predicted phosphoribosyltransferase